jgi:hypothetical protein
MGTFAFEEIGTEKSACQRYRHKGVWLVNGIFQFLTGHREDRGGPKKHPRFPAQSVAGYRQTAYTRKPHAATKTSLAFGPSIANQNKNICIE